MGSESSLGEGVLTGAGADSAGVPARQGAALTGEPSGACPWYGSWSYTFNYADRPGTSESNVTHESLHARSVSGVGDCLMSFDYSYSQLSQPCNNRAAEVNAAPGSYQVFDTTVSVYSYPDNAYAVTRDCGQETYYQSLLPVASCPPPDGYADRMGTVQAIVLTCRFSETAGDVHQDWESTIRIRRSICDEAVDSDGDNLADCTEYALGTDPMNPDTDGDGLTDGHEVLTTGTDPKNPDTDGDGVKDGPDRCKTVAGTGADGCPLLVQALFTYDWLGRDAMDLTVVFDGRASSGSPTTYEWNYGDGETGVGSVGQHTYAKAGRYNVSLTVRRGTAVDSRTRSVVVNPIATFAPKVHFTKGEKYYPMDQRKFIKRSSLRWAHDKAACDDHSEAPRGAIDMYRLGHGGYRHHEAQDVQADSGKCLHKDKEYRSDQATRPYQSGKANAEKPEGFYLDLKDSYRDEGVKPRNGLSVPVYVSYESEKYITYWFMYGYDNKGSSVNDVYFGHEGEWERIIVHLVADEEPSGTSYYQHNCPGEFYGWDKMIAKGFLNGTHPMVFAAKGAHASYPEPITVGAGGSCAKESTGFENIQGMGDKALGNDEDAIWKTWKDLAFIHRQPWYGYGGAWGEVVTNVDSLFPIQRATSTGPMGPPHLDPYPHD